MSDSPELTHCRFCGGRLGRFVYMCDRCAEWEYEDHYPPEPYAQSRGLRPTLQVRPRRAYL